MMDKIIFGKNLQEKERKIPQAKVDIRYNWGQIIFPFVKVY